MIYELGKISVEGMKYGKNMDLLAIEILTITDDLEVESDFRIYCLSLIFFGDVLFLLWKIDSGELILAENCDFWILCKKYIASILMWFHNREA